LSEKYSSKSLIKRIATCFEISESLGKENSLYWLVFTNVSDSALTFAVHKVAIVSILFKLLRADTLQTLTPFTIRKIWLPDSETTGMTWLVI
jgi:hypothetical protein